MAQLEALLHGLARSSSRCYWDAITADRLRTSSSTVGMRPRASLLNTCTQQHHLGIASLLLLGPQYSEVRLKQQAQAGVTGWLHP